MLYTHAVTESVRSTQLVTFISHMIEKYLPHSLHSVKKLVLILVDT